MRRGGDTTLPRPVLRLAEPAVSGTSSNARMMVRAVHALARAHAALTRGALLMPVLALLDRALPDGPLPSVEATMAPGVSVRLDGAGALARGAVITAGYEHREAEAIAAALRPAGVFLDVGANVGWFSLLIACHRPDVQVWALEPVPATADQLIANVAAAGLAAVEVMRVAAGTRRASAMFATHADNAFAHRLDYAAARLPQPESDQVRCEVVTIDELWTDHGRPRVDAMKVDVEGAELDVLRGAETLIRRDRPLLVVEAPTEGARADLLSQLAPFGYQERRCRGLLPYNSLLTPCGLSSV